MNTRLYRLLPLLVTFAALPAFAATSVDKTVAVKADGAVHISAVAGDVHVATWDKNKVNITGTLADYAKKLDVEKTAEGVKIRVVVPNGNTHCGLFSECTRLSVQLPKSVRLDVQTVSGDVNAAGLAGPVKLHSTSGDFKLQSTSDEIDLRTTSGDISMAGSAPSAKMTIQTTSGDVHLDGIHGTLDFTTTSGDLRISSKSSLARARIESTSGDIVSGASLKGMDTFKIHSVSGDVTLDLPRLPAASFDVKTTSGDIEKNFGKTPVKAPRYGPGASWESHRGNGKPSIEIRTVSGDIHMHVSQA